MQRRLRLDQRRHPAAAVPKLKGDNITESLKEFVTRKRLSATDEEIRQNLVDAGWDENVIEAALLTSSNPKATSDTSAVKQPIAVVNTYTARGVEYSLMFFSLWIAAISLGSVLHYLLNHSVGRESFIDSALPIAGAALMVAAPVFYVLLKRLRRYEAKHPDIREDQSRRRAIQLTVLGSFLFGMYKVISYAYQVLDSITKGGSSSDNSANFYSAASSAPVHHSVVSDIALNTGHTLITLVIAGVIFFVYWRDMQRSDS